jgi:hypothetical protein
MTETTGLYNLANSGDITTAAWSGLWWRRATSNNETPPTFTWTSETANIVIVSIKGAKTTADPIFYLSSDDTTIPFTQDQSISTPSNNCLVVHGIGQDIGAGAEPYPGVAQVLYAGDAGANGIGVCWAFYPTSGSIGNPTFWCRVDATPTQIHTAVIEDDGNNTEVQGYVDRGTTPCTLVTPLNGATIFGWAHQASIQQLVIGNPWTQVWWYNGSTYSDETTDANDIGTADIAFSVTINSALYLGSNTTFSKFGIYVSTARVGGTVQWQYWDGSTWTQITRWTDYLTSTGAHSFEWVPPSNWAQTTVNSVTAYYVRMILTAAGTTAGAMSMSLRDGAAVTYDAIAAASDIGVNPYHNASNTTPSSNAYNLGGNELLYTGGIDLSSGYLLCTYFFTAPRDWVDLAFLQRLGIVIYAADTNAEGRFKAWIVGAKDAVTTYADRRNIFAIQLSQTEDTFFAQRSGFASTATARIGFTSCQPYGSMSLTFSMLMKTGNIVIAGGKSTDPLSFDQIIDAILNGCCLFPFWYKVGSAVTVWAPTRIGGGDPVHVSVDLKTIQFPSHYSAADKRLDYHVDADQNGIEFYGKSGDTIKFTNCVFTSESSYFWKFNTSSSSGATVDFGGSTVINANVTLDDAISLSTVSFLGCKAISAVGATLNSCTFRNTTGNGALLVASAAEMDKITNCNFENNTTYGIRLTNASAAEYDFDNIQFSGNTKDVYVAATSGTVTINILNGGDTPTYTSAGATVVINNPKTLTLTGLISGSEVRIYDQSGPPPTELAGIESSSTTFAYEYNYAPSTYVDIVVHKENYLYYRIENYLLLSNDVSLPISQQIDRQYYNP